MKAIYINLDPYLAAFAAWLKANPEDPDTGARATPPPAFDPLPLAVTIPLGDSAAIFKAAGTDSGDWAYVWSTVDGVEIGFKAISSSDPLPGEAGVIASDVVPALSAIAPATKYGVFAVDGDTTVTVTFSDGNLDFASITFTVLVRRETASGPVDLVDFTPPATLTAAAINTALGGTGAAEGQPLKGVSLTNATNAPAPTAAQINTALGGSGAETGAPLNGVSLGKSIIYADGNNSTDFATLAIVDGVGNVLNCGAAVEKPIGIVE